MGFLAARRDSASYAGSGADRAAGRADRNPPPAISRTISSSRDRTDYFDTTPALPVSHQYRDHQRDTAGKSLTPPAIRMPSGVPAELPTASRPSWILVRVAGSPTESTPTLRSSMTRTCRTWTRARPLKTSSRPLAPIGASNGGSLHRNRRQADRWLFRRHHPDVGPAICLWRRARRDRWRGLHVRPA